MYGICVLFAGWLIRVDTLSFGAGLCLGSPPWLQSDFMWKRCSSEVLMMRSICRLLYIRASCSHQKLREERDAQMRLLSLERSGMVRRGRLQILNVIARVEVPYRSIHGIPVGSAEAQERNFP